MMLATACLATAILGQSRIRANGYEISLPGRTTINVVAVTAPGGMAWSPSGGALSDEGLRGVAELKLSEEVWRNFRPQDVPPNRSRVIFRLTSDLPFEDLALRRTDCSWRRNAHEAFLYFWIDDAKADVTDIDIGVGWEPWKALSVARHVRDRFVSPSGFDMAARVKQVALPGGDPSERKGGSGTIGVECRLPKVDFHEVTSLAGGRPDDSEESVETRLIMYFRDGSSDDADGGSSGNGVAKMTFTGTIANVDRIEFQSRACNWIRFTGIHTRPSPKAR